MLYVCYNVHMFAISPKKLGSYICLACLSQGIDKVNLT
nr:MAG TPA: hypothetical protein [Bacteriophage sp.]